MPLLRQAVTVSTSTIPSTLTSCSSAWLSLSVCLSVRLSFHLAVRPFFCSSRHPCVCPHSFESRINQLHLSSTQLIFGKQSAVNQLLWQLAPFTRPGPVRPSQARSGQGSPPSPLARSVPVEDSASYAVCVFFRLFVPFRRLSLAFFVTRRSFVHGFFFFVFAAALAGHGMPDRGRGGGGPPVDCPFYEPPLPLPAPLCMLTLYQMGLKSD